MSRRRSINKKNVEDAKGSVEEDSDEDEVRKCCSVLGCVSSGIGFDGRMSRQLSFHRVPENRVTRKFWLQALKFNAGVDISNAIVCSDHFLDCCLKSVGQTVELLEGAVPLAKQKRKARPNPKYVEAETGPTPLKRMSVTPKPKTVEHKRPALTPRGTALKHKLKKNEKQVAASSPGNKSPLVITGVFKSEPISPTKSSFDTISPKQTTSGRSRRVVKIKDFPVKTPKVSLSPLTNGMTKTALRKKLLTENGSEQKNDMQTTEQPALMDKCIANVNNKKKKETAAEAKKSPSKRKSNDDQTKPSESVPKRLDESCEPSPKRSRKNTSITDTGSKTKAPKPVGPESGKNRKVLVADDQVDQWLKDLESKNVAAPKEISVTRLSQCVNAEGDTAELVHNKILFAMSFVQSQDRRIKELNDKYLELTRENERLTQLYSSLAGSIANVIVPKPAVVPVSNPVVAIPGKPPVIAAKSSAGAVVLSNVVAAKSSIIVASKPNVVVAAKPTIASAKPNMVIVTKPSVVATTRPTITVVTKPNVVFSAKPTIVFASKPSAISTAIPNIVVPAPAQHPIGTIQQASVLTDPRSVTVMGTAVTGRSPQKTTGAATKKPAGSSVHII